MHDQENVNAVWLNIGQLGMVIKWEKVRVHLCIERKRGKVILKQDNVGFKASLTSESTSSSSFLYSGLS